MHVQYHVSRQETCTHKPKVIGQVSRVLADSHVQPVDNRGVCALYTDAHIAVAVTGTHQGTHVYNYNPQKKLLILTT